MDIGKLLCRQSGILVAGRKTGADGNDDDRIVLRVDYFQAREKCIYIRSRGGAALSSGIHMVVYIFGLYLKSIQMGLFSFVNMQRKSCNVSFQQQMGDHRRNLQ